MKLQYSKGNKCPGDTIYYINGEKFTAGQLLRVVFEVHRNEKRIIDAQLDAEGILWGDWFGYALAEISEYELSFDEICERNFVKGARDIELVPLEESEE